MPSVSAGGGKSKTTVTPYGPTIGPINNIIRGAGQAYNQVRHPGGNLGNPVGQLFHQMSRGAGLRRHDWKGYMEANRSLNWGRGFLNRERLASHTKRINRGLEAQRRSYASINRNLSGMASGDLVGSDNPYVQNLLGSLQDRVRNDVGGQFAAAGRSFSGAHADALGKGYGQALAPVEFQNYQDSLNKQLMANQILGQGGQAMTGSNLGAAGQIASNYQNASGGLAGLAGAWGNLGAARDASQLNRYNTAMAALQVPFMPAQSYSNLILPIGQSFPTTETQYSNWSAGIGMSDRRTKTDIEPVGETYDGQRIYRFRYIGDKEMRLGLMADEVLEVCPEAVVEIEGIKFVDYQTATDEAVIAGAFD